MDRPSPGLLAQFACLLEATARKAGNVHRFADFDDATYVDFLLSAAAISGPLDRARNVGLGATVREAIAATHEVVATNTNLGMVLLLTPLAMLDDNEDIARVGRVLGATTVEDARLVYEAVRLAQPGGLGRVTEQDVADAPTVTLREAMRLAAPRDVVARQYVTDFADVMSAVRSLRQSLVSGHFLETAIVATHLAVLQSVPDTLIARKRGEDVAREASRRAADVLERGWPASGRAEFAAFDRWLREDGHARNPGATADLVTAALFLSLRDGTIPLPLPRWSDPFPE